MPDWKLHYENNMIAIEEAVSKIESGDVVWAGSSSAIPYEFLDLLADRYESLENVTVISNLCLKPIKMLSDAKYKKAFHFITIFEDAVERAGTKTGMTDVNSIAYSYVVKALRDVYKVNTVLAEVTEPDAEGVCNVGPLGTGWTPDICQFATKIIGVVNRQQVPVKGNNTTIHVNDIHWFCRGDHPMPIFTQPEVQDIDRQVAPYIVERMNDGDTFQIGRGGLANAIGYGLKDKKHLKVHTEIITDSIVELAKAGVVDHIRTCGAIGNQELYEFCSHDMVEFGSCYDIIDPESIGKIDNFVSINSCLMADLTGQVCSEAIGPRQHSSVGGQLDFVKGCAKSKGGRSFLCLRSTYTDKNGKICSNILAALPPGAVITTPRTEVMYIVSEYGVADLYLKSIKERIKAMIAIAHPDCRESLKEEVIQHGLMTTRDFE